MVMPMVPVTNTVLDRIGERVPVITKSAKVRMSGAALICTMSVSDIAVASS